MALDLSRSFQRPTHVVEPRGWTKNVPVDGAIVHVRQSNRQVADPAGVEPVVCGEGVVVVRQGQLASERT
ncbi:hypothetical protein [Halorussus litoreus]|uniref:hypothetical protein n=1 Tax=Halorussus litoreus TaxID=1710536 RepID=UPI0013004363|nr:hypothetical protein [Halorussus litoreus]